MLRDRNFNIGNFCKLTAAGLEVAEFVDIRETLIQRYKEVYGSDIDLSTASADGLFVNDLAVIMNNILQTMKTLYSNLDVNSASGVFLDNLCRLSNVVRKQATRSTASLTVTNLNASTQTFADVDANGNPTSQLTFVDKSGTEWIGPAIVDLAAGASTQITVTCTQKGQVSAPAGWITTTLLVLGLEVEQPLAAIMGENVETDTELKKRRSQSSGADGVSVLESLIAALLQLSAIEDVRVYNNNTVAQQTAKDGTPINAHNVYVILRQLENIEIDDTTIGNVIFGKLTPGVKTTEATMPDYTASGIAKQAQWVPEMMSEAVTAFTQNVYWKRAKPIAPQITIKITPTQYWVDENANDIFNDVKEYANNIQLSEDIDANQLFVAVLQADPYFRNNPTYTVMPANVSVATSTNPDTYYNYNHYALTKNSDGTITITISYQEET